VRWVLDRAALGSTLRLSGISHFGVTGLGRFRSRQVRRNSSAQHCPSHAPPAFPGAGPPVVGLVGLPNDALDEGETLAGCAPETSVGEGPRMCPWEDDGVFNWDALLAAGFALVAMHRLQARNAACRTQ
jgi:hypothetical protein